jgi:hypothetical protein
MNITAMIMVALAIGAVIAGLGELLYRRFGGGSLNVIRGDDR